MISAKTTREGSIDPLSAICKVKVRATVQSSIPIMSMPSLDTTDLIDEAASIAMTADSNLSVTAVSRIDNLRYQCLP